MFVLELCFNLSTDNKHAKNKVQYIIQAGSSWGWCKRRIQNTYIGIPGEKESLEIKGLINEL